MRVGGWRYILAVQSGEIGQEWKLGSTPSRVRNSVRENGDNGDNGDNGVNEVGDESGVDQTLMRCWLILTAISKGWAQHDLLQDLETLFK